MVTVDGLAIAISKQSSDSAASDTIRLGPPMNIASNPTQDINPNTSQNTGGNQADERPFLVKAQVVMVYDAVVEEVILDQHNEEVDHDAGNAIQLAVLFQDDIVKP